MQIEAFIAYQVNRVVRKLPRVLTDNVNPLAMPKSYLKKARENSVGIAATWSNQAICAKYCGNCPSNPLTHGGLYCISGKSKKQVSEDGCNCFECELFEECGGGKGYFCKHGNVDEMKAEMGISLNTSSDVGRKDAYEERFVAGLFEQEEKKLEAAAKRAKKPTKESFANNEKFQINFVNQKKKDNKSDSNTDNDLVESSEGKTILEAALAANLEINHVCGGNAKCSTCRVLVIDGNDKLLPRNEKENALAQKKRMPHNVRLACQAQTTGRISIKRLISNPESVNDAIQEGTTTKGTMSVDKDLVVFFSDIRGFTTFSENNYAYDTVFILNKYFEMVGNILDKYNGYIDKYMGDGIMVLFGLLDTSPYSVEEEALRASLEVIDALTQFNIKLKTEFNHEFAIGIGLHKGSTVLSNLGYNKKRQFTAIGDTVNTAARIESETKNKKTPLLISDSVYEKIKDLGLASWREEESILLKGKVTKTKLYSFIKDSNNLSNQLGISDADNASLADITLKELIEESKDKGNDIVQFKK